MLWCGYDCAAIDVVAVTVAALTMADSRVLVCEPAAFEDEAGPMLFKEPAKEPELLLGVDSRLFNPVLRPPAAKAAAAEDVVGVPPAESELETEVIEVNSGFFLFAGEDSTPGCIKGKTPPLDEAKAVAVPCEERPPAVDPNAAESVFPNPLNLTD